MQILNRSFIIQRYRRQCSVHVRALLFIVVLSFYSDNHLFAVGIPSVSLYFKYPETFRIIREQPSPFYKLKKADRKILKKEIRIQYNRLNKTDEAKQRVHIFFLILSLVSIFLGSLFLAFIFAYGRYNVLAVFMVLIGIGAFAVVLYFGIKKSNRLKSSSP